MVASVADGLNGERCCIPLHPWGIPEGNILSGIETPIIFKAFGQVMGYINPMDKYATVVIPAKETVSQCVIPAKCSLVKREPGSSNRLITWEHLDSGSNPTMWNSSGMTALANCDTVSKAGIRKYTQCRIKARPGHDTGSGMTGLAISRQVNNKRSTKLNYPTLLAT
jgi:hypothetical protein